MTRNEFCLNVKHFRIHDKKVERSNRGQTPLGPKKQNSWLVTHSGATLDQTSRLLAHQIEQLHTRKTDRLIEQTIVHQLFGLAQITALNGQRVLVGTAALLWPRLVLMMHIIEAVEGEGKEVFAEQLDNIRVLTLVLGMVRESCHVNSVNGPFQ